MTSFYRLQQPCFDARQDDEFVCQTFRDGVRQYCSFANAQALIDYQKTDPHCNELLHGHVALGYFDLDATGMQLKTLGWTSTKEFVAEFSNFLIEQYAEHLGITIAPKHLMWADATTPEKVSFHIVVHHDDYYWSQEKKTVGLKQFTKLVEQATLSRKGFYFLSERNNEVVMQSVLDSCVVSKNRCFRMLGCTKPGKWNPLLPLRDGEPIPITDQLRRKYLITVPDTYGRTEPVLKSVFVPKRRKGISRSLLQTLATQYGSEIVKTSGSLIQLRNKGVRKCPINGELNTSDNAFFIRKDNCLFLGCHNSECQGRLHKIHQFESRFKYYEDHRKIIDCPKTERASSLIKEYVMATTHFVDRPDESYLISYSKSSSKHWPALDHRKCIVTQQLFKGKSDIVVSCTDQDKPVKFSGVLKNLLQERRLKTFSELAWCPYLKSDPVVFPPHKLNTFSQFSLDNEKIETDIDFTQTRLFELLNRLCNFDKACTKYLLDFIALRLQKPGKVKPGIALCFLNSKPGSGKGTFKSFLEALFACHRTTVVSYNKLKQFTSQFNAELEHAIFLVLEEVSAKVRDIGGLIKDLTTTQQILLEPKGENRRVCEFYGTLMMFSNRIRSVNIARNDRRMCVIESNSEKANCGKYFVPIHAEIKDVMVMRSAFKYFEQRDISSFDYRKFPKTRLREQVQKCSDSFEYKFYKHLFTQCLCPIGTTYKLTESELYEHWREFVYSYGSILKRDRGYVTASFESEFSPEITPDGYVLDCENVRLKLSEIIGV